jgi:MOSC domain-containing protein YiiM
MVAGSLVGIFVTPHSAAPMQAVAEAEALAGRGLSGDRYGLGEGTFAKPNDPTRHVTLIEREAVEAAQREYGIELHAAETRRNLLTAGVPLNHLVGQTFRVGGVLLRGLELCEPCGHLEKLTRPGVRKSLIHRGGLRAEIVEGGKIKVGDPVESAE